MIHNSWSPLTNSQESLLHRSTELPLDGLLDVVAGQLLVLGEDLSQLLVRAGDQNGVEHRRVRAPLSLASLEQVSGISHSRTLIHALVLVTVALHQRHAQVLEGATGVVLQVLLQGLAVHLLVELGDGLDSVVGQSAEDLDDRTLVSTSSVNGIVQLLGVELGQGSHQSQDDVLEFAAQLGFQVTDQVLSVLGLEGLGDLQTLDDSAAAQDFDDGLLVGAESLHRLAQGSGILDGIEGLSWVDGGGALNWKWDRKKL